ncbi:MAG: hypothetical protein DMD60_07220 [Gemmatimonadetes bacterium]|nr:MAG: hypothetical protein DMD60_07220 [Gemmatimonadota bacterium]
MSHRSRVAILLLAAVTACEPLASPRADSAGDGNPPTPGGPLLFLTARQQLGFRQGRALFQTTFSPATGLGPLFNARSCAECHEQPVVGGVGDEVETHATAYHGGVCDDLARIGGPVIQDSVTPALHAALGIDKEPVPPEATAVGRRTTPSLLGFGLLDAVPDSELAALADPDDRNGDGISGRLNRLPDGRLGRFGRKAQIATLREFTSGAFINEMGITSPPEPHEQTIRDTPLPPGVDPTPDPELEQAGLDATDAFVKLLAPPPPTLSSFIELQGRKLFATAGCTGCHVPLLHTGPNPVRALSNTTVAAYTDLLLHDMGPELADICLGQAEPAEFRTEPLMGVQYKEAFLHDGRAPSIEAAIQLHAGEAAGARDRFLGLSPQERAALLRFVSGL